MRETGSGWLQSLTNPANRPRIILAEITLAEVAAALAVNSALLAARLSALTFVAADDDLLDAARAEGLTAENPNDYP